MFVDIPLPLLVASLSLLCILLASVGLFSKPRPLYQAESSSPDKFNCRAIRLYCFVAAVLGLGGSIFTALWATTTVSWTVVAAWGVILLQCSLLLISKSVEQRYDYGLVISLSSVLITVSQAVAMYQYSSFIWKRDTQRDLHEAIPLVQVSLSLSIALACGFLPRLPSTYDKDGRLVDPESSQSLIGRYTFVWADRLFEFGRKEHRIQISNLATLGWEARSASLQAQLGSIVRSTKQPLWRSVYQAHKARFHLQWALAVAQAILAYAPQVCIYQILRILEQNDPDSNPATIWLWAVALGVFSAINQILGPKLFYLCLAKLEVRVRSQLTAVIFDKALRLQDVKSTSKSEDHSGTSTPNGDSKQTDKKEADETSPLLEDDKDKSKSPEASKASKGENREPESQQQVLNLIAVDANRVGEIACRNYVYLSSLITFVVATIFLVRLIGWISFGAGLLMPILFVQLNKSVTMKYGSAQAGLMKARDDKLEVLTEGLKGIKQIKFTASEDKWEARLMELRTEELKKQRSAFTWIIILRLLFHSSPIVLAVVSLSVYALLNGSLSASVAFTSIGVFSLLEFCMSVIPLALMQSMEAFVSAGRIEKFLNLPEKKQNTSPGDQVTFKAATVSWPTSEQDSGNDRKFTIKGIDAKFPNHALSVIYGPSGSGKSLLLACIIGEATLLEGSITVPKVEHNTNRISHDFPTEEWILPASVAFVSQIPWIENASIKDNILFGLPLNDERYEDVLQAAALKPDLAILIDGDSTEVGASGINLSGGQRWRLTFARALYSRAEILVLDDIFSAVDSHVGSHLMKTLTGKLCQGRTRILATHHASRCLTQAEYAIRLGRGGYVEAITNKDDHQRAEASSSATPASGQQTPKPTEEPVDPSNGAAGAKSGQKPMAFVEEEVREEGAIKLHTYTKYMFASGGTFVWIFAFLVVLVGQLSLLARVWWVKVWTESDENSSPASGHAEIYGGKHGLAFYLSLYIIISFFAALMEAAKCAVFYYSALKASKTLFQNLLHTVLRAPLRWLDTVPTGRILSRFTGDFNLIDSKIPGDGHSVLSAILGLCMVFVSGLFLSPYMSISAVLLCLLTLRFATTYLHGAREIRRLESVSKSPVLQLCGSTLSGLGTVRAFGVVDTYTDRMSSLIDDLTCAGESFWLVAQWLEVRTGLLGSVYALSVGLTIAAVSGVDAPLAGLALSFALSFSGKMDDAVARCSALQLDMNSTERVLEYTEMDHEPEDAGVELTEDWPSQGRICFEGVEAGYAKNLPAILKDLTVEFGSKQRIGIVGRTGSGKSTLALALFRLIVPSKGRITVDGIDLADVGLKQLRSRMAIIPQDPVLFTGTLRSNLDPFEQHTDAELRNSLEQVHLVGFQDTTQTNFNVFEDLESPISEGGLNLSQGQRQLLCLARATLLQARVMVLDEATSAVDRNTDEIIQRSIRKSFTNSTLVVIAHRLTTVADFDRILVMDDGRVAEFGSPKELYGAKGAFYDLVNDSGEREELLHMVA